MSCTSSKSEESSFCISDVFSSSWAHTVVSSSSSFLKPLHILSYLVSLFKSFYSPALYFFWFYASVGICVDMYILDLSTCRKIVFMALCKSVWSILIKGPKKWKCQRLLNFVIKVSKELACAYLHQRYPPKSSTTFYRAQGSRQGPQGSLIYC